MPAPAATSHATAAKGPEQNRRQHQQREGAGPDQDGGDRGIPEPGGMALDGRLQGNQAAAVQLEPEPAERRYLVVAGIDPAPDVVPLGAGSEDDQQPADDAAPAHPRPPLTPPAAGPPPPPHSPPPP